MGGEQVPGPWLELGVSPNPPFPAGFPSVGWTVPSTHWAVPAPFSLSRPQSLQALSLLLPLTRFPHPSSGLLPSPWALLGLPASRLSLSPPSPREAFPHLALPCSQPPWLPSAPRTEPQPPAWPVRPCLVCALPTQPVPPTYPFCHPKLVAATEPRHEHQTLSPVPGTQDELSECLPS